MSKLTTARVAELLRTGTPAKASDGNSLFLIVRRPGVGYWVHSFRDGARFNSRGLGRAPAVTLAQARRAREAHAVGRRDRTGAVETSRPARDASGLTGALFGAALLDYIQAKAIDWRGGVHGSTAREYMALGSGSLARLSVTQITDDVIRAYVTDMRPKAKVDTRQRIEAVVKFMQSGDVKMKAAPVVHHAAVPYADVPAFMAKLATHSTPQARALAFIVLTCARMGEVVGDGRDKAPATWGEIEGDVWTIPAERMKAGKIHRVPLTPAALALLGTRGAPDVPLFAISRGPTYDLLKALAPAATVHGFRSSFKDWCNENAVDNNLSEIALAHGVGTKVEQAYARSDLFERRRELMQKWSDFAT